MRLLGIIFLEAWTVHGSGPGRKHVNPFTCPFGGCLPYDEEGITVLLLLLRLVGSSELTKNFRLIIANEYGMAA